MSPSAVSFRELGLHVIRFFEDTRVPILYVVFISSFVVDFSRTTVNGGGSKSGSSNCCGGGRSGGVLAGIFPRFSKRAFIW